MLSSFGRWSGHITASFYDYLLVQQFFLLCNFFKESHVGGSIKNKKTFFPETYIFCSSMETYAVYATYMFIYQLPMSKKKKNSARFVPAVVIPHLLVYGARSSATTKKNIRIVIKNKKFQSPSFPFLNTVVGRWQNVAKMFLFLCILLFLLGTIIWSEEEEINLFFCSPLVHKNCLSKNKKVAVSHPSWFSSCVAFFYFFYRGPRLYAHFYLVLSSQRQTDQKATKD